MKKSLVLLLMFLAHSLASETVRMEAMGWVNDSKNKQSRDLGICELEVRLTVFNDGDVPITLPSLILSNVAVWNSHRSPTLLLTYTPWRLMTRTKKEYPNIP